jgi:hypothetical protein
MNTNITSIENTIASISTTIADIDVTIANHDAWLAEFNEGCQRYKYIDLFSARMDFWCKQMQVKADPEWFDVCHQNFYLCMDRWEHLHDMLCG